MFDFINSFVKNNFGLLPKTNKPDWITPEMEKSDNIHAWIAAASYVTTAIEVYTFLKEEDEYEEDDEDFDY